EDLCNPISTLTISSHSQISTSEIVGVHDPRAIDFYDLRGVDEATKEKKKEQQRMRAERIKTKRLSIKKNA
uniref:Uncharacterized protein n=1 Tax=Aegilops tauschii subsp. strangulata TaxID=200361 RepID=A0A453KV15_AEGTS